MKNKRKDVTDLSKEEIRQIVGDIFHPKRITNIHHHKRDGYISCTIYFEWEPGSESEDSCVIPDEIEIYNPFENGLPIHAPFSIGADDIRMLRQFCFANGIVPEWMTDNPYMKK